MDISENVPHIRVTRQQMHHGFNNQLKNYAVNGRSEKIHNRIVLLAMHYVIDPRKSPEDQHSDEVRIQYMIDILGLQTLAYARLPHHHIGYAQSDFGVRIDLRGFIEVPDVVALDYRWLQDDGYFLPGCYGNNWFRYDDGNNNGKIGKCIEGGVKVVLIPNNQGGNVQNMYKKWLHNVENKSFKVQPLTLAQSEKYHPLVLATMYSKPNKPELQHAFVASRNLACYKLNKNKELRQ